MSIDSVFSPFAATSIGRTHRIFLPVLAGWLVLSVGCYQGSSPSTPQTTVPILIILLSDQDISVRRTAADSLGKIGDLSAEPFLLRALHDSDGTVREAAARSFGRLPAFGQEAGTALMGLLRDSDVSVRRAAAQALGASESSLKPPSSVVSLLTSPDSTVRQTAAHVLLLVKTPEAAASLATAATDADPAIRQWAVAALGESGDQRAIPMLIDRLLHDPMASVRVEAAYRLGFVEGDSLAQTLDRVVHGEPSLDVRRWAEQSRRAVTKGSDSDSEPRSVPLTGPGPSR